MHACIRKYVKEKCGKDPSLSQILLLVISNMIILFIRYRIDTVIFTCYLLHTVFHFPVSVK